jgi:myo-inositol-1(or 4)-monophosphatase
MFEEYLEIAKLAARIAGAIQLEGLKRDLQVLTKSSPIDLVTEIDRNCEAEIVRQILQNYPDHQILAEEGTTGGKNPDFCWIIDPLDGTTNYTHRYPNFAVSIGLQYKGELAVGVIYEPVRDEMFTATAGGGAFLNNERIKVSKTATLSKALLGSGLPGGKAINQSMLEAWERISACCQGVRRDGSAALDLCYVACGRYDGYWERPLFIWDIAAGALIVQEAGGQVSNFDGTQLDLYKREIVATNGKITAELLEALGSVEPMLLASKP